MSLAKRNGLFSAYLLALVLAHLGILRLLFDASMADVTGSHLMLIPFVSMTLIFRDRRSIFASVQTEWASGVGVILLGAALFVFARLLETWGLQNDSLSWMVGALVVLALGGFLLIFGSTAFRLALFPLLFLGFMIPIPGALLDTAIQILKSGSTEVVAALFSLTGTPYFREGFVFELPEFAIEVADECSGIRSSIALLLTSLIAGHVSLQSKWAKLVLVLAVFPITVFKNGVRIAALSLLARHVDPGFLTGQLHHEGGFLFFLVALAFLVAVIALLRRWEPNESAASKLTASA